jgi:hypothetical protein
MVAADEILVPSHATVRGRLPGLAGQAAAVDQGDGDTQHASGDLVAHVHLVDGDGAGRCIGREGRERIGFHITSTDEEAALASDGEGAGIGARSLRGGGNRNRAKAGGKQQCAHVAFLP